MNTLCRLRGGLLVFLAAASTGLAAQPFPSKAVRIVCPGPAGSVMDVAARQLAEKLAPALGQPVIVDNKPGAAGQLGMESAARSAPDGYTIAITNFSIMAVNPHVFESLSYDPVRDFAPVILLYHAPLLMVVHPSLGAATLAELIRQARAQPGKLQYGSSGNGLPPHIYTELFKHVAGVDLQHIPYKGAPASAAALLAGEVKLILESASVVIPHARSGRLTALAVTGDKRIAALPEIPTFAEAGVPGMGNSWVGIVAPAATPRDVVIRLNREFARAMETPEIRASYESAGRLVAGGTPEKFDAVIRAELGKWREVAKHARIRPG